MDRPVAAPRHCRRYVAASVRAAVVLGRRRQPRDSGRSPPSTARGQPDGTGRRPAVGPGVQLIRSRAAPAALLLADCDTILVVGALVAEEMYDVAMPIVELVPEQLPG